LNFIFCICVHLSAALKNFITEVSILSFPLSAHLYLYPI
jgi:hypothetical protein